MAPHFRADASAALGGRLQYVAFHAAGGVAQERYMLRFFATLRHRSEAGDRPHPYYDCGFMLERGIGWLPCHPHPAAGNARAGDCCTALNWRGLGSARSGGDPRATGPGFLFLRPSGPNYARSACFREFT